MTDDQDIDFLPAASAAIPGADEAAASEARRASYLRRRRLYSLGRELWLYEVDDDRKDEIGHELMELSGVCALCRGEGIDGDDGDANGDGGWIGECSFCGGTGLREGSEPKAETEGLGAEPVEPGPAGTRPEDSGNTPYDEGPFEISPPAEGLPAAPTDPATDPATEHAAKAPARRLVDAYLRKTLGCVEADHVQKDEFCFLVDLAHEALATPPAPQPTARTDWQQRCLDHGFQYVRAPDDHYVICTPEQAANLLRDVLGVDAQFKAPQPHRAARGVATGATGADRSDG